MRLFLTLFSFLLISITTILAQAPTNDDCSGLVDLGAVPICEDTPTTFYTNVDATASDIGFGNSPSCFNGGTVQNDVWFGFQTTTDLLDLTITIQGSPLGPTGDILNNPQVALYRGDCVVDGLAELFCLSADNGETSLQLDVLGLTPNTQYFLRINDYSASATPNWGDFSICIDEFVPAVLCGESSFTTACFGTFYDSGGPDGDYSANENCTFTICPADFHQCIELNIPFFNTESGFDELQVFAGEDTSGELIATIAGGGNGNPFPIQISDQCVTLQFTSDGSVQQEGFEVIWECSPLECDGSSVDNPTDIGELPFNGDFSTCEGAATFGETACGNDAFLNGPEYVFVYNSPGNICASVVTSAGGVLVLNGPPNDPNSVCVAQAPNGNIASANFQEPGEYYIVVANADGCIDFNLDIQETDCPLSAALVDALCNPLNGCIEDGGVPSVFLFEDGFEDLVIDDPNQGCWLGVGIEPDFYWFTIEAQADGPFGFILESADNPSDIDFNVWGPFTNEDVCENPNDVIDFISNNQPIRSSWAAGADPTGLADINPVTGLPVEDEYDCGGPGTPGAGGDDFVTTIPAQEGEVYVILVNDFGNQIAESGISVDWGPSSPDVLAPVPIEILAGDTAVCAGETVQIELSNGVNNIEWITNTGDLSCLDCPNPTASPNETTTYQAVVDAVCYSDTINVKVEVYNVDAGPDQTLCGNDEIQIVAGSNFEDAGYSWQAPDEVNLSCLDCPDPFIISSVPGTYILEVTLGASNCILTDQVQITVLDGLAPEYEVVDNQQICIGESINIGGDEVAGNTYVWTSIPPGFASTESNPEVSPDETTTYFVTVTGTDALCPFPSIDSVTVEVFELPSIAVANDTLICQGESIFLGNTTLEENVAYSWDGPGEIEDATDPNTLASPQQSGTYTLTATRGACEVTASFDVEVATISVEIDAPDTLQICLGTEVDLSVNAAPAPIQATWTPDDGSLSAIIGNQVTAIPEEPTTYIASVEIPGCIRQDTITILVDSLPSDMTITPMDTTVCEGEIVLLQSPVYEPSDFPNIAFEWLPSVGFETPDSLYNMVISAVNTTTYRRINTNGACLDSTLVTVNVDTIPDISIMPMDTSICAGESVDIVVEVNAPVEDISWSPQEGLSCTDCFTPTATPLATTDYNFEATAGVCSVSISTSIEVAQPPSIDVIGDQTICPGDALQLNSIDDGTSDYVWTSPDDPDFSSTDPLLTVNPAETTTYNLMATNACGTMEAEVTITVLSGIEITVSDDLSICTGDEITLNASSNLPEGEEGIFTWTWENGNTSVGPNLSLPNLTETTVFNVSFDYACGTIEDQVVVTVNLSPFANLVENPLICFSGSIILNDIGGANVDDLTFEWSSPDDPDFSSTDPAPLVSPDVTTTYEVVVSNEGCPDFEGSVTVQVVEQATVTVSMDTLVCSGDMVTLFANGTAPDDVEQTYTWFANGEFLAEGDTVTHVPSETTEYTLEYNYGLGCEIITQSVFVEVIEGLNVELEVEPVDPNDNSIPVQIDAGVIDTVTAIVTPDGMDLTYEWTVDDEPFGGNTSSINHTSPIAAQVIYSVTVTNSVGCTDDANIVVEFTTPTVAVPNVFSPDGDGTNDFFFPVSSGGVIIVDLKIYNRWGQLVFDNDDLENGWDGNYNGNPAPSDVYIYKIQYKKVDAEDATIFEEKGDLTLLR